MTPVNSHHMRIPPMQLLTVMDSAPPKCKNPHNSLNPITLIRYENVRLGLKGGSPMWSVGGGQNQKPGEESCVNAVGKHGLKGGAPIFSISSDKGTSNSTVTKPSDGKTQESITAVTKVSSLVAADYNDFDDENSQLTPPGPEETPTKPNFANFRDIRIPSTDVKHEIEISSELELLAESENIVIIDHLSEDNIATSEDIEDFIASSSDIAIVDEKEKIEQVVEEDEQHVVMMIEENTLATSFSIEQRDKGSNETIVEQPKSKSIGDPTPVISQAACVIRLQGNDTYLCGSEVLNVSTMVKLNTDTDVESKGAVGIKTTSSVVKTTLSTISGDRRNHQSTKNLTAETQSAMNLIQECKKVPQTDRSIVVEAEPSIVTDVLEKSRELDRNSIFTGNSMNVTSIRDEKVVDHSSVIQDSANIFVCQPTVTGLDKSKVENSSTSALVVGSQKCVMPAAKIETVVSTPLIINKTIKEVIQMLSVVDSPQSPDQQEMNVDPSPEPYFDDSESPSNKALQEIDERTVTNAPTQILKMEAQEHDSVDVPKDVTIGSVCVKENIGTILKEENEDGAHAEIQQTKLVECNNLQSTVSNLKELPSSSIHHSHIGTPCSPVHPVVSYPTTPNTNVTVDTIVTKPVFEQQNVSVSQGATSVNLLDTRTSPSCSTQYVANSSLHSEDTELVSVSNRRQERSAHPVDDCRPVSLVPSRTTVALGTQGVDNVPMSLDHQSMPLKQELPSLVADSVNLAQLSFQPTGATKLPSHSSNVSNMIISSVITSVPKNTPAISSPTSVSIPAATQPSSVGLTNRKSQALNLTMMNMPQTSAVPVSTIQSVQGVTTGSLPPKISVSTNSACTLSIVSSCEAYTPVTSTLPSNVLAPSTQISQLLNLPAISFQTLIQNNQLFKSCSSSPQTRNVLISNTQSLTGPVMSARQSVGTKFPHAHVRPVQASLKSSESREIESVQDIPLHNQSKTSEGEHAIMPPMLDETSKLSKCRDITIHKLDNSTNSSRTSHVQPQVVSVLESRLILSSENSYQQTPTNTNIISTCSLLSDNSPSRPAASSVTSQSSFSRPVPNIVTKTGVMASTITTNITSNQTPSVSTQPSFNVSQRNKSDPHHQPPAFTSLLKVKEEKVDDHLVPLLTVKEEKVDNFTSSCINSQNSCKFSPSTRLEESQNVLLKQLLQNTGCAQTQSVVVTVPSLEAQLAQPVPSTPSSLIPPLLLETGPPVTKPQPKPSNTQLETSFVSRPRMARTPSRDDVLSPQPSPKRDALPPPITTPMASPKTMAPPVLVSPKKEIQPGLVEIKKEIIEEPERKVEMGDMQDQSPSDIKKMKRRQYQQKRRQSQGKEAVGVTPKKRQKKSTTVEEDWDTFMENLMQSLQQLPPIHVQEPSLPCNPIVGTIFGAGDLTKIIDSNSTRFGELQGMYGAANIFQVSDFYDSKPFGDCIPLPPPPPISTQRGFYDQEFAPLKWDTDPEDKKSETLPRDTDSPDSVVSSSSPECLFPESPIMFPGLRLINPDSDEEEDNVRLRRSSPVLPLVVPIPIRLKPLTKDVEDVDKENRGSRDALQLKSRPTSGIPLRDSGNVAVTLTLSSAAADDIMGVLRDLANFLHIPAPTGYQIVERTSTPPSQKLGLYRTKGKDGKEGAPIDIQSILNGEAKFCRHCDVVILNNLIKKKVSDLPFLAKEDIPDNEDFLNFCSTSCYMQFALMHRSPSISQDKAAATVDHLCQTPISVKTCLKTNKVEVFGQNFLPDDLCKLTEPKTLPPYLLEKQSYVGKQAAEPLILPDAKISRSVCYKKWSPGALQPAKKLKKPTDREITELLFRLGITVMPSKIPEDTRACIFCHHVGDGVADGAGRLLNFDVDKWIHLNCALWSDDVYETVNGALMNMDNALQLSLVTSCVACHNNGATIRCFKVRCSNVYHLGCAVKAECVFFKNKSIYCTAHVPKNEKDNELTTLAVFRRVYVNRDENRQVASVMHRSDHCHLMRVGSLIFLSVGQLLPHQLQAFHTPNCIYPIGYKIVRFYWSMRVSNKRCRYVCSIHDVAGRPEFRVLVQEPNQDDLELRDSTPKAVWARILEPMSVMRKEMGGIQVFPRFVSGEDLFGLTEPAIVRVLESLPGVESMTDYRFKYGRNPLLELPLAVNPTGCARSEPKLRIAYPWKRPHTQRTATSSRPVFVPTVTMAGEAACPYSKQFVHSKSSQYKKMKQEWRNNVYLARSKIQGLGLYAARDLERHTMVIEYIGEVIRTELSEMREKLYEARNRGIYMFRLDEERVVDATLSGGLARYINHSCNPNCVAEIVEVDRDLRIIIFAKRRITRGEELAYDYKFDIEDDQHKIPCNCGAANCKKWMN